MRWLLFTLCKNTLMPVYRLVFLFKFRIVFRKEFSVSCLPLDRKSSSTHLIYKLRRKTDSAEFIIKQKFYLVYLFVQFKNVTFSSDKDIYEHLLKLKCKDFLSERIPKILFSNQKIIYECIAGVPFDVLLQQHDFPHDIQKTITSNAIRFFKELHKSGYVHGDIKKQNILVCENYDIYIIDWDNLAVADTQSIKRDAQSLKLALTEG